MFHSLFNNFPDEILKIVVLFFHFYKRQSDKYLSI